jgi:putative ABC transport system substrate-binding protein
MRDLGWVEGQSITIERRSSDGYSGSYPERLEALLADVMKLNFDVVVGSGEAITMFAKRAPSTVAVVMAGVGEPVEAGLVKSLAQPGGNVTGLASLGPTINNKRLQLLKEAAPQISRVAFLDTGSYFNPELVAAANSMALTLLLVKIDAPEDFQKVFANVIKQRMDAVFVGNAPFFYAQRHVIVEFAERHRLPAMYPLDVYVKSGGLMSYGTNFVQLYRRAATYVDKILKGTKPRDLPIEQAATFDLVINLKTAKALGLMIPQSLLQRADEVIQ